jgi:phosphoribosyl-ATP pyrophosphohydrolase/phosphoribosyl-AMP cyclohydrolase
MNESIQDIVAQAKFNADGLIPAVVQDAQTREVLMVAYMNEEALRRTLETGDTHFYSRSRKKLWHKGETSGNFQKVQNVRLDCDSDTILVEANPVGPSCHTGSYSCFGVDAAFGGTIQQLYDLIVQRKETRPEGSYTTKLFDEGIDKIAKKLGEEAVETVIAAKNDSSIRLIEETADLLYHLMVTLVEKGVTLPEIQAELAMRHKTGQKRQG